MLRDDDAVCQSKRREEKKSDQKENENPKQIDWNFFSPYETKSKFNSDLNSNWIIAVTIIMIQSLKEISMYHAW